MYRSTADLHHFHARTGSHSTKGSGRGTVWWGDIYPLDEVNVPQEIRVAMENAKSIFKELILIAEVAAASEPRDIEKLRQARFAMRQLNKNYKAVLGLYLVRH